eukprot:TRINITY_DN111781_c0_g1_i1.p1 TRINITY_DN111781_c0_g1~~TRINITY_DN111781_c0_g1_i1.p1  ORF type:complete len:248 (-),score=94.47 TRINITY_DN111781_c0_g1_i1:660-1403(-)
MAAADLEMSLAHSGEEDGQAEENFYEQAPSTSLFRRVAVTAAILAVGALCIASMANRSAPAQYNQENNQSMEGKWGFDDLKSGFADMKEKAQAGIGNMQKGIDMGALKNAMGDLKAGFGDSVDKMKGLIGDDNMKLFNDAQAKAQNALMQATGAVQKAQDALKKAPGGSDLQAKAKAALDKAKQVAAEAEQSTMKVAKAFDDVKKGHDLPNIKDMAKKAAADADAAANKVSNDVAAETATLKGDFGM